jgi:hypothetical protein
MAAKQGLHVLLCMPDKTKGILLVSVIISWANAVPAQQVA